MLSARHPERFYLLHPLFVEPYQQRRDRYDGSEMPGTRSSGLAMGLDKMLCAASALSHRMATSDALLSESEKGGMIQDRHR